MFNHFSLMPNIEGAQIPLLTQQCLFYRPTAPFGAKCGDSQSSNGSEHLRGFVSAEPGKSQARHWQQFGLQTMQGYVSQKCEVRSTVHHSYRWHGASNLVSCTQGVLMTPTSSAVFRGGLWAPGSHLTRDKQRTRFENNEIQRCE